MGVRTDLMEVELRKTLERLNGGDVEEGWWRRVLNEMVQDYVAPVFFKKPAIRSWLNVANVQEGFLALASANVMNQTVPDEANIRKQLAESYSEQTGEAQRFAEVPIDAVVGSLTAGYFASIPRDQRGVAGMVQALEREVVGLRAQLERHSAEDPQIREALGKAAEVDLYEILRLRLFDYQAAIKRVAALWERVDGGNLARAPTAIRNKVCYWAARLHASDSETATDALRIRSSLLDWEPESDLRILDALMMAAEGDSSGAMRMLRDDDDDPEARSVLLGIQMRSEETEAALAWCRDVRPNETPSYFTDLGWRNWALCLAKGREWEIAAEGLASLASQLAWPPALAMTEGMVNAALLLPTERRMLVLEGEPTYAGIAPSVAASAKGRHARALECFDYAEKQMPTNADQVRMWSAAWRTWLELMDPDANAASKARQAVCERLERGGEGCVRLVSLAWSFGISFDDSALRQYLRRREKLGGLGDEDQLAECLLNQRSMESAEFAEYVERRIDRLDRILQKPVTTAMLFEALLNNGQVERARALLEKRSEFVDQQVISRMETALKAAGGGDPRTRLEKLYRESGNAVDLRNLIEHLKTVRDREALGPLVYQMFTHEPTLENAREVVGFLSLPPTDHRSIVAFLEAYPAIVEQCEDTKSALAWGLFHVGRVHEARAINEELLYDREEPNDLSLSVNIAVVTGDWEQLAAIVDREWPHRMKHEPNVLIMLARIANEGGQSRERAAELARLAAEKAPEDPHVLIAAHMIHVQLGLDEKADPRWLGAALAHSSEQGPLWQADLQMVASDWLPRMRERNEDIERKLLEGALPIAVAAGGLNTPLSRLLLDEGQVGLRDGRSRPLVPITSGLRNRVDLQHEWTVGMDATTIMVLARIGLLDEVLDSLGQVKVAPDVMGCLFNERAAVRFHQPVRVEEARRLRRLIDQGRIKVVEHPFQTPSDLVEEVGSDLAVLLEASREEHGVVICALPIHKAQSLMEELANTSGYDDLILSPADLLAMAYDAGRVDSDQHEYAKTVMASLGQVANEEHSQSLPDGPIHLDSVALSYLQSARVLEPIANGGLDLRIHTDLAEETKAIVEAGEAGDELAEAVEGIRDSLRRAMEFGTVSLLPRTPERSEQGVWSTPTVDSIEALIFGSSEYDALCVDDRSLNRHPICEGPDGQKVPIVCVLDLLRYLRGLRVIGEERYWTARHNLREAGFAFVPIEAEELTRHLLATRFSGDQMLESGELRVIRQTVNRFDSLGLLKGEEARTLSEGMARACVEVIRNLWIDDSISVEVAAALSNWIWSRLPVTTYLAWKGPPEGKSPTPLEEFVSGRLGLPLVAPMMESVERRSAYRQWLEWTVISPVRSASVELVEHATSHIRRTIDGVENHRELVGGLFLECLPDGLQEKIVESYPEFAGDCGFSSRQILEIEGVRVVEAELIAAAESVFSGDGSVEIAELASVRTNLDLAEGADSLCLTWVDEEGEQQHVNLPELTLLCPNEATRSKVQGEILAYLGPTATRARTLVEASGSRRLSAAEVSAVFAEKSRGVVAVQARLAQGILTEWQALTMGDLVPPSRAYWESFCGPVPDEDDPESYFSVQLMPYRRSLVETDLVIGLDFCCLGALRDDLSPGAWLEGIGDETLLKALASVRAEGNPIALLGVLDVALYRVGDKRFRRIAEQCVTILLDERLGFPEGYNGYRLFEVLVDFESSCIGLVEGTGNCAGFWRRMCAWMQAGLIARTAVACRALPDLEKLEKWCWRNRTPAGSLRRLADCRTEPLVIGHAPRFGSLRCETLLRLSNLVARHRGAGRDVPKAAEIEAARKQELETAQVAWLAAPGPAELHMRPDKALPEQLSIGVTASWTERGKADSLSMLANLSQFFVLGERELELVEDAVKSLAQSTIGVSYGDVASHLNAASIIAAATGTTAIADSVGAAIAKFAALDPRRVDIEMMVHTVLRAAAAYRDKRAWWEWLQDRMGELAGRLPSGAPEDCLREFFYLMEWMGLALPVQDWFHVRAQHLASAGLESP